MARRNQQFQTIRSEGALLPPDILQRIAAYEVDGVSAESYHLSPGTKLNEEISRSWTKLLGSWKAFREELAKLPEIDETAGVTTRERWLLPLFQELGYGRLTTTKAPEIDGRAYPINRFWKNTPIHLLGCRLSIDHRTPGAAGAARMIPHGIVQEFLNRSADHLWAFLSNGLLLRILRDNISLSRQAYVDFDLESMMDGEVYPDFALLWMICHESRVEAEKPEECWLEKWSKLAQEQGTRVLADLRMGVTGAIEALGRGFVGHRANDHLRHQLESGDLSTQDCYRQILRIVYRLLFLFKAEDRRLLHPTDAADDSCAVYDRHFSTRRLRDLAERVRGSRHPDLWHSLSLVFDALGRDEGCPELGLPGLGSFLWSREATPDLLGPEPKGAEPVEHPVRIANGDLLEAIRALAYVEQDKVLRAVDYRNLGVEELGSVYESLLELHPEINAAGRSFSLNIASGHERKASGSYYTPDSLVQCLLDSALEPVVADRLRGRKAEEAEEAILDLKVCDPACGSGHFLIGAAHRLARHLARARSGESEPSPDDYRTALRDVIRRCLYGVDINPMAAELCKVALWIESLEPGKPLTFLDHHIRIGNSLLGATPDLMAKGIADDAFKLITGDDKEVVKYYKKRNKQEHKDRAAGQRTLLDEYRDKFRIKLGNLPETLASLSVEDADTVEAVRDQQRRYEKAVHASGYENTRLLADAWCAAFVWKKHDTDHPGAVPGCAGKWDAITESIYRAIEEDPHAVQPWIKEEIKRLASEYQFFHWHLEFPEVFGWADSPPVDGHLSRKLEVSA